MVKPATPAVVEIVDDEEVLSTDYSDVDSEINEESLVDDNLSFDGSDYDIDSVLDDVLDDDSWIDEVL